MAKKEEKTNVMRVLDQKKLPYESFFYDPEQTDAQSVAELLGQPPMQVFKTLVTVGASGAHPVFMIPACRELDLKKAAKAAGEKSIQMLPQKELLPLTGYIHGGCSPIGMKKAFPTYIDASAETLERLCCSGGRVGAQVRLSLQTLRAVLPVQAADLCREEA